MNNLKFLNLSRSPIDANEPAWQTEILDRVSAEYSDEARKVNREFRTAVLDALQDNKLLAGRVIDQIERQTPRYEWIKNIDDGHGNLYDAEIDLLKLTVTFGLICR